MHSRILAAIRSQPWAILPEYLEAIEAIAVRALDNPALVGVEIDGHQERMAEAVAEMGAPMPGTRSAAIRDGVASMPLFGPVFPRANMMTEMSGATSLASLAADFRKLEANPDVHNILIVADSPGGQITDVRAFGSIVAASKKPVTVFASGLCCSAAYHICSQAKEVIADPFALIGSIGVMMSARVQEDLDRDGGREISIVSSNAPDKRPDLSTEEGRAKVRAMLDGIEEVFLADVARGRGVPVSTVKRDFGAGGTKSARQAKEAGMIDKVEAGGLSAVLARLSRPSRSATPRRAAAVLSNEVAQLRASSSL
ncbi:S49 family peptidase [Sphingopyxis indica]|uniref:S49 family peptidase n=1 Tax=Sphingopyxis indica TaxID=436663 RepID=UPI002939377B|nr:S49 family peptidase [Sphingopyxis indica]WOF43778.1 S49 family peptidase [Sphingopyxis indica]